jgi:hypothetical protein
MSKTKTIDVATAIMGMERKEVSTSIKLATYFLSDLALPSTSIMMCGARA